MVQGQKLKKVLVDLGYKGVRKYKKDRLIQFNEFRKNHINQIAKMADDIGFEVPEITRTNKKYWIGKIFNKMYPINDDPFWDAPNEDIYVEDFEQLEDALDDYPEIEVDLMDLLDEFEDIERERNIEAYLGRVEENKDSFKNLKREYIENGATIHKIPEDWITHANYPQSLIKSLGYNDNRPIKISVVVKDKVEKAYNVGFIVVEYIFKSFELFDRNIFYDNHHAYKFLINSYMTIFERYHGKEGVIGEVVDGAPVRFDDAPNYTENDTDIYLFVTRGQAKELRDGPNKIPKEQIFALGESNCLLKPLKTFYTDKLNEAMAHKNKKGIKTYRRYYNHVMKLLKIYTQDKGIPQGMIQEICDTLNCSIHIYDIFRKSILEFEGKNSRHRFRLINTKFNHVDEFVDMNDLDVIEFNTQKEIQDMYHELIENKDNFMYYRARDHINKIITCDTIYELKDAYKDTSKKFNEEIGIKKVCGIDLIKDKKLSEYLSSGVHLSGCKDYTTYIDVYRRHYKKAKVHDLDHEKNYTQFKSCKYYKGFMPKPSDRFRKINIPKEQYREFLENNIGIYTVVVESYDNVNPKIKEHLKKLKLYELRQITLPCVELLYMMDLGIIFRMLVGCFSHKDCKFEFEFNDDMKDGRISLPTNDNTKFEIGPRYFAKWSGSLGHRSEYDYVYCRNDPDILNNMMTIYDDKYEDLGKYEARLLVPKTFSYWCPQVFAFIVSYARIQVLSQLFEFEAKNIIRVNADGFFFLGDVPKLHDKFRMKDNGRIKSNSEWPQFLSGITEYFVVEGIFDCFCQDDEEGDEETATYADCSDLRQNSMSQYILKIGCGGGGKTYNALSDKGYNDILYVAPSHKLLRSKHIEFPHIKTCTVSKLVGSTDKEHGCLPYIKKYCPATIVCDEITQYTNDTKLKIKEMYKYSKIIFCGDINRKGIMYQLPCPVGAPFKIDDFMAIEEFNVNRRSKCKKLTSILQLLRKCIDQNNTSKDVINAVKQNKTFQVITINNVKKMYDINDYILCSRRRCTKHRDSECNCDKNNYTNEWTNTFTDKFDHEKYFVTKKSENYCNGDIVIGEKKPPSSIIRHAFTCHAIQGETIRKNKIFIDTRNLFDNAMFYTAVSRAEYWNQIYLII